MKPKKQTPKMSGLVVAALRNLRDAHGSSAREIMKYIMAEYNASEAVVQRQLKVALKRGVDYGILKKTNGGYSLNTDAEVIGPLDLEQMDSCKKRRRRSCRPKRRSCRPKRRSCPRRRRRRNPCNVCSARGSKGDCSQPVQLVIGEDDEANQSSNEAEKSSENESNNRSASRRSSRQPRSRSQSEARMSASDDDDDDKED